MPHNKKNFYCDVIVRQNQYKVRSRLPFVKSWPYLTSYSTYIITKCESTAIDTFSTASLRADESEIFFGKVGAKREAKEI